MFLLSELVKKLDTTPNTISDSESNATSTGSTALTNPANSATSSAVLSRNRSLTVSKPEASLTSTNIEIRGFNNACNELFFNELLYVIK